MNAYALRRGVPMPEAVRSAPPVTGGASLEVK
jgi:hypothetical protein